MSEARSTTPAVVAKLVAGHREFLRFLERRVGDRAVAEDILQEAFVRGVARADEIREETAVAWFYRTLRNAVVDHYRRRGASARALASLADEMAGAEEPAPEVKDAICQCVAELAGTLKPEYARAIRRIEVDGLAVKDFAAEAGITAGNAAVRVFRAREALRKQVAKSCGSCAEHGCLECSCGKPGGGCKPPS
jgi:RNA polymerase sigma-70 factor (ECF subfamily)